MRIPPLNLRAKIPKGIKDTTEIIQELFSKGAYKEHTKIYVLYRT
jgi:hypothetical protein